MHFVLLNYYKNFDYKLFIFRPLYCAVRKAKASLYKCQNCKENILDRALCFYCGECLDDDFDFGIQLCEKCLDSEPHMHPVKKHSPSNPHCVW